MWSDHDLSMPQMLWADSHLLGCGAAKCLGGASSRAIPNGGPYIICLYAPG